jgi:ATP-dependent RNA helicase RhlE
MQADNDRGPRQADERRRPAHAGHGERKQAHRGQGERAPQGEGASREAFSKGPKQARPDGARPDQRKPFRGKRRGFGGKRPAPRAA